MMGHRCLDIPEQLTCIPLVIRCYHVLNHFQIKKSTATKTKYSHQDTILPPRRNTATKIKYCHQDTVLPPKYNENAATIITK